MNQPDTPPPKKPVNPHLVLLMSLIPGAGHVAVGMAMRGLQFLFFMIILGWVSHKIMPLESSFFGRNIGGILIYGLSVIDAYKIARIKAEVWRHASK